MSRKIFHIYTKTFGGKIWNNLHRVSPGNFVGKNFDKVCFLFPAKIPLNSISCAKFQTKVNLFSTKKFKSDLLSMWNCACVISHVFRKNFLLQWFCTRWCLTATDTRASWQNQENSAEFNIKNNDLWTEIF